MDTLFPLGIRNLELDLGWPYLGRYHVKRSVQDIERSLASMPGLERIIVSGRDWVPEENIIKLCQVAASLERRTRMRWQGWRAGLDTVRRIRSGEEHASAPPKLERASVRCERLEKNRWQIDLEPKKTS